MLFNHKRESVAQCQDFKDSKCPLCGEGLVPKRYEKRVTHWAHQPVEEGKRLCPHVESDWHLRMKLAALMAGYEIEVPIEINGTRYLRDAVGKTEDLCFVHTLSTDYYRGRIKDMLSVPDRATTFLFDGCHFSSTRGKILADGVSYWSLIRPKSAVYYRIIMTREERFQAFVHLQANKEARCFRPHLDETELFFKAGPVFDGCVRRGFRRSRPKLLLYKDNARRPDLGLISRMADQIDPDHPEKAPEAIRDRLFAILAKKVVKNM